MTVGIENCKFTAKLSDLAEVSYSRCFVYFGPCHDSDSELQLRDGPAQGESDLHVSRAHLSHLDQMELNIF